MGWIKNWYSGFAVLSLSAIVALSVYIWQGRSENRHEVHLSTEEREWLDAHDGEIRIGADIDYIPMDFINRWGEHDGIAEDFFKIIEGRLGIRFKRISVKSWSGLLDMAKHGEVDVIKCLVKSPERMEYLQFTQPYLVIPSVIITAHDTPGDSLTLSDLKGRSVVVNNGYYIHEYVMDKHFRMNIIPADNNLKLFEALSTASIDYALTDLPTVSYYVRKLGITNLRVVGETGVDYGLAAAGRKDWPLLNSVLSKAIDSITGDEKDMITGRWISVEYNRYLYSRGIFIALVAGVFAVLCLILVISVWNKSLHVLVQRKTDELEKYKDSLEELVDERTRQLRESNSELTNALASVKTLSGLLPICANCKKIRNDKGYWEQIENYLGEHTGADFSHSICPDCAAKLYPGLKIKA